MGDGKGPAWLQVATGYLGTKEVTGKGSNPTILKWAKKAGGWIANFFTDDDIPWCALFVNACLDEAGLKGTGSLAARSFETWGRPLPEPALGAVLVFSRNGGGHVGFYLGENSTRFRVRGGNQGNAVSDTWILKSRLTAIRWPTAGTDPSGGPIQLADDGSPVSTNEA